MNESKSLDRWRFELQSIGKKHWLTFYKDMLGVNASSVPRLYKALNLYGDWALFEAIISSSDKDLNGDPLNYVIAVTKNIWKEKQEEQDREDEYSAKIREAKEKSEEANKALEEKLLKVEAQSK